MSIRTARNGDLDPWPLIVSTSMLRMTPHEPRCRNGKATDRVRSERDRHAYRQGCSPRRTDTKQIRATAGGAVAPRTHPAHGHRSPTEHQTGALCPPERRRARRQFRADRCSRGSGASSAGSRCCRCGLAHIGVLGRAHQANGAWDPWQARPTAWMLQGTAPQLVRRRNLLRRQSQI